MVPAVAGEKSVAPIAPGTGEEEASISPSISLEMVLDESVEETAVTSKAQPQDEEN